MSTTQELPLTHTSIASVADISVGNETSNTQDRERREHRRYPVVPQLSRIIVADSEEGYIEGHVHDVSESGLLFECDEFYGKDEVIEFRIELPGSAGSIGGQAKIVRTPDEDCQVGPWMMAAGFLEFQDRFEPASLMQYVKQNESQVA